MIRFVILSACYSVFIIFGALAIVDRFRDYFSRDHKDDFK